MTTTREKIEELKRLAEKAADIDCGHNGGKKATEFQLAFAVGRLRASIEPETILSLLALAERALEPQGQALPIAWRMVTPEQGNVIYLENQTDAERFIAMGDREVRPLYASQLALPAGPEQNFKRQPTTEQIAQVRYKLAAAGFESASPSPVSLPAGPVPELGNIVESLRQRFLKLKRNSFILSAHGVKRVDDSTGRWVDWDEVHTLLDPTAIEAASPSPAVAQPVADEDGKRIDYLETLRQESAAKGFKWNTFSYDTDKPIRATIDSARAASVQPDAVQPVADERVLPSEMQAFADDDAGRKAFVLGYNAAIKDARAALSRPVPSQPVADERPKPKTVAWLINSYDRYDKLSQRVVLSPLTVELDDTQEAIALCTVEDAEEYARGHRVAPLELSDDPTSNAEEATALRAFDKSKSEGHSYDLESYCAGHIDAARAALCQPAEEGGKA